MTTSLWIRSRVRPRALVLDVAVLAFALLPLSACQRSAPAAAAPALVVAQTVRTAGAGGEIPMSYPVEAAARYSNALAFRVGGKLIERRVRLGDGVRQGEVLARLDTTDAEAQSVSAKAALESAEHRLVYARQQLDRDQAQAAQNLIAANQLEQTQDGFTAAQAARDQAAAAAAIARDNVQYNALIADHDGVITSENANTGEVVTAGQPVYSLAWSGDVDANLDAAASDLARLAVGQSASVSFTALPGRNFEARVRELAPAADAQSRGYRIKLSLLHPGGLVRLGMTGEATLAGIGADKSGAAPSFLVPATAIFHQGNAPAVWIIRPADSLLELRPVTVVSYGERDALVSSGVREGEIVVAAGVHTVFAGEHAKAIKALFADEAADAKASGTAP